MLGNKNLIAPYLEWAVATNFAYLSGEWFRVLLEVEGSAEGRGDGLEAVAHEQADEEAYDECESDENREYEAFLAVPVVDVVAAELGGGVNDVVEEGPHAIHLIAAG